MPKAIDGYKRCSNRNCENTNPQPVGNFESNIANSDGLQYWCRDCRKRKRRTPEYRKQTRQYAKRENWKESNKRYKQSEKGQSVQRKWFYSDKGKETRTNYWRSQAGKEAQQREYQKHPLHRKARIALTNAVRDGKLPRVGTQKCTHCPKQAQQYHHHNGYEPEHWLDVIPVCIKCHNLLTKFGVIPNNDALSSVTLQ